MRCSLIKVLAAIVLLIVSHSVPRPRAIGQDSPEPATAAYGAFRHKQSIRETRELIEALRQAAGIPGLSVAMGVGDRLVWAEGFGVADLETGAVATATTRYRAASVSKLFTVAAAARLWAENRLEVDAPVSRYPVIDRRYGQAILTGVLSPSPLKTGGNDEFCESRPCRRVVGNRRARRPGHLRPRTPSLSAACRRAGVPRRDSN